MFAAGLWLLAACSNDSNSTADSDKQRPVQGLVFSMSEAPYNDDVDIATRTAAPSVIKDTLNMGDVAVEITLERDNTPVKQPATRAITSGNHYTIVAFNAGTAQQAGEVKGYFDASGVFQYETGGNTLELPAGNYDFVCYTHQYATRSGNTVNVDLANAGRAFVCRKTNVTVVNAKHQEIAFAMKHAGVRVRTKLVALTAPTGVVGKLGYGVGKVAATAAYDMVTGTFTASTVKNTTAKTQAQSYDVAGTVHDAVLNDDLATVTGNDYLDVLPGTKPEDLIYNITAGTVYNATLNTNGNRAPKVGAAFAANSAYTLTIKLMPRYLYLFEDGQTGHLSDPGRANHVPIAIVYDVTGRRALSLWNANGGALTRWCAQRYGTNYIQDNDVMFASHIEAVTPAADQGKHWTWDASGSKNGTIKADQPTAYPAFYYAGNFYNSTDLTSHLNGKPLAASLNKRGVWYLPATYDWDEICLKLGFATKTDPFWYPWKVNMVNYACIVAGGTQIGGTTSNAFYSTSTELSTEYSNRLSISWRLKAFHFRGSTHKNAVSVNTKVRPVVNY